VLKSRSKAATVPRLARGHSLNRRSDRAACNAPIRLLLLVKLGIIVLGLVHRGEKNGPAAGAICESRGEFQEAAFVLTDLAGVCLVTTFLFLEP
jgi:hypothetical protein